LFTRSLRRIKQEELDWRLLLATHLLTRRLLSRIDLVKLLEQLAGVIESDKLSISQGGVAVFGAAYIHRLRTETVLAQPRDRDEQQRPDLYVPPPIEIPLKPGLLAATMLEIVNALRPAMRREQDSAFLSSTLQADLKLDEYLVKIEEELEEFIDMIKQLFGAIEEWALEDVFQGVSRLEAARRFILLLLAAGRGFVEIYQDEESGKILVRWLARNA